jgi:hypothetical protein
VSVAPTHPNGLSGQRLTNEEFDAGKAANQERVVAVLDALVPELAR